MEKAAGDGGKRRSGWGERIKSRARELGMTDVAVARALGIAQRRFSAYANETREPDFELFVRICHVLRTTPDAVLGFSRHPRHEDAALARIEAAATSMPEVDRIRAAIVMDALAAHASPIATPPAPKKETQAGLPKTIRRA